MDGPPTGMNSPKSKNSGWVHSIEGSELFSMKHHPDKSRESGNHLVSRINLEDCSEPNVVTGHCPSPAAQGD